MKKDTSAIDKIYKEMVIRDYKAALKIYKKQYGKRKNRPQFSYSLGADTMECREIKQDYLCGKITEEEYKAYCIRYNLSHLDETQDKN